MSIDLDLISLTVLQFKHFFYFDFLFLSGAPYLLQSRLNLSGFITMLISQSDATSVFSVLTFFNTSSI